MATNSNEIFLKDFQRSDVDLQCLILPYVLNYVREIESSSMTSISFPVVVRKYHDKINSMKSSFWHKCKNPVHHGRTAGV